jgi:hypothetical protein
MNEAMTHIFGPSWRTSLIGTVLGLIPAAGQIICGASQVMHIPIPGVTVTGNGWEMIANGIPFLCAGLVGIYAKDHDVTGGARPAAK